MKPQEILEMANQIRKLSKAGRFDEAYQTYKKVKHPELFYILGIQAYNLDHEDIAKKCFIEGAKFCTQGEHKYYNTIFSNSIGQCITLLFTQNLLRTQNNNVLKQLFILGHLYLSDSINMYGTKAYESYYSRYKLMKETKYTTLFVSVLEKFGVLVDAIPLMNASDLYESSVGYSSHLNNFMQAEELIDKAYNTLSIFISLFPDYNSTPEQLFDTGKMINNEYFKKMNDSKVIFTSLKVQEEIY